VGTPSAHQQRHFVTMVTFEGGAAAGRPTVKAQICSKSCSATPPEKGGGGGAGVSEGTFGRRRRRCTHFFTCSDRLL